VTWAATADWNNDVILLLVFLDTQTQNTNHFLSSQGSDFIIMVEFNFNINSIFPEEISIITTDLIPTGYNGDSNYALLKKKVCTILDVMGEASAGAQNLKNPITSGSKMMTAEGHTVYLLVDRQGAGGQGAVVAMLKVGRKKLFLLDTSGKPNEMSPMCVLDFYVTEKRQRTGCGKKLFETMLQRELVDPRYLAVDRPSDKLISFLRKHYGLANIIPQVNNYVIFSGFFKDQPQSPMGVQQKKPRIYMGKLQYV